MVRPRQSPLEKRRGGVPDHIVKAFRAMSFRLRSIPTRGTSGGISVLPQCAAVVQLVEAPVLKTGCWGFEPPAPVFIVYSPPRIAALTASAKRDRSAMVSDKLSKGGRHALGSRNAKPIRKLCI